MADLETIASDADTLTAAAVNVAGEKPFFKMTGYCGACGTWDEHGACCAVCGYGFVCSDEPADTN